jgi:prepilin-type N-terminal cleavage/methylation domain-containing protein
MNTRGFTIVELLIVIVVIAILAAISFIAFNGIQNRAVTSVLQSDLRSAVIELDISKIDSADSTFPANEATALLIIKPSAGTVFQYTYEPATNSFCLTASNISARVAYFINSTTKSYTQGVCSGHSDPTSVAATETTIGTAQGDGSMNFRLVTNDNWSNLTMTWDPQPSVKAYEIQYRNSLVAGWYAVNSTNGGLPIRNANDSIGGGNSSSSLSASLNSVTWTSGIPPSVSKVYQYKLRYIGNDNSIGPWNTATLNPLDTISLPVIKNIAITPNGSWTNTTISWDSIGQFSKMPDAKIIIHTRTLPDSRWYAVNPANGGTPVSLASDSSTSDGGNMAATTTSVTWTQRIPSAGNINEYRLRVASGTLASSWSVGSIDPVARVGGIPTVQNLTLTPVGNYASMIIAWDDIGDFAAIPGANLQIQYRIGAGTWYAVNPANGGTPVRNGGDALSAGSNFNPTLR